VVIGLQEFVPVNERSDFLELNKEHWEVIITKNLLKSYPKDNYTMLSSNFTSDLCLFLYVKKEHVGLMKNVKIEKANMGLKGMGADKGAAIIK